MHQCWECQNFVFVENAPYCLDTLAAAANYRKRTNIGNDGTPLMSSNADPNGGQACSLFKEASGVIQNVSWNDILRAFGCKTRI
jgi:hypothetical protein